MYEHVALSFGKKVAFWQERRLNVTRPVIDRGKGSTRSSHVAVSMVRTTKRPTDRCPLQNMRGISPSFLRSVGRGDVATAANANDESPWAVGHRLAGGSHADGGIHFVAHWTSARTCKLGVCTANPGPACVVAARRVSRAELSSRSRAKSQSIQQNWLPASGDSQHCTHTGE